MPLTESAGFVNAVSLLKVKRSFEPSEARKSPAAVYPASPLNESPLGAFPVTIEFWNRMVSMTSWPRGLKRPALSCWFASSALPSPMACWAFAGVVEVAAAMIAAAAGRMRVVVAVLFGLVGIRGSSRACC